MSLPRPLPFFVSAPYPLRDEAQALAGRLAVALVTEHAYSTARWLRHDPDRYTESQWARVNREDVQEASILIALNPPQYFASGTGGRHVELGLALAWHMPAFVLGVKSHIYHDDGGVVLAHTEPILIQSLQRWCHARL